jgi:hypothetical protein
MTDALTYIFSPHAIYAYTAMAVICQFVNYLATRWETPRE